MPRLRPAALVVALALSVLPLVAQAQAKTQADSAQTAPVVLKVGGRQTLSVPNVTRVAVSDPDVADIRVDGGKVEVTGRAAGATQVQVWRQDGARVSFQITVSR